MTSIREVQWRLSANEMFPLHFLSVHLLKVSKPFWNIFSLPLLVFLAVYGFRAILVRTETQPLSLGSEFYLTEHRLGWAERERLTRPLQLILHIMSGPGHRRAPTERLVRCWVLTWINFIEGSQSWNVRGEKKSLITQITEETDSCRMPQVHTWLFAAASGYWFLFYLFFLLLPLQGIYIKHGRLRNRREV